MSLKPKITGQRGDTIVEVMVVLAVLGLAIGISYSTANRSLLNTRQAQESSQATELVQSQVEALRTLTQVGNPQNIFQPGPYCLSPTPYTIQTGNACSQPSLPSPSNVSITYVAVPTDTFTVVATWPDALGQGNDTVTLVYRLHQHP
jgi:prepilin-type N-terminal cleavage/methylation domain-containing protein